MNHEIKVKSTRKLLVHISFTMFGKYIAGIHLSSSYVILNLPSQTSLGSFPGIYYLGKIMDYMWTNTV